MTSVNTGGKGWWQAGLAEMAGCPVRVSVEKMSSHSMSVRHGNRLENGILTRHSAPSQRTVYNILLPMCAVIRNSPCSQRAGTTRYSIFLFMRALMPKREFAVVPREACGGWRLDRQCLRHRPEGSLELADPAYVGRCYSSKAGARPRK